MNIFKHEEHRRSSTFSYLAMKFIPLIIHRRAKTSIFHPGNPPLLRPSLPPSFLLGSPGEIHLHEYLGNTFPTSMDQSPSTSHTSNSNPLLFGGAYAYASSTRTNRPGTINVSLKSNHKRGKRNSSGQTTHTENLASPAAFANLNCRNA